MVLGQSLTKEERSEVLKLYEGGKTITAIYVIINRCCSAVRRVITQGTKQGGQRRTGPKRKVLQREVRLLLRQARTGEYSARQLRDLYAPMVTVRRVQQLLAADPHLTWRRPHAAPKLTASHRAARHE